MKNEIIWINGRRISVKKIIEIEEKLGIDFPEEYKKIIINNDGGKPNLNCIDFGSNIGEDFSQLIFIREHKKTNISDLTEWFYGYYKEKIVPFAHEAGGSFYCFDYRNGFPPTIVFWDHEFYKNKKNCFIFVAESFAKLLDMLYEYKEDN